MTDGDDDLRDPRIDAAWRAASREEPPRALDDAIRAAARREVGAGPQRASDVPQALRPERWWWPLAAAATIGAVAIGILQVTGPDRLVEPAADRTVVSDVPASPAPPKQRSDAPREEVAPKPEIAPRPPAAVPAPAIAPPTAAPPALRKDTPPPVQRQERAAANIAPPPAAEPFPADAKTTARDEAARPAPAPPPGGTVAGLASSKLEAAPSVPTREAQSAEAPVAQAKVAAAPAALPARRTQADSVAASGSVEADARAKVAPKLPPDEWIALIRRLRDEGRADEAAKELAAFRAAYADHERRLPVDLRDWKP